MTVTSTDWTSDVQGNGRYAEVNGINLYYATQGAGRFVHRRFDW